MKSFVISEAQIASVIGAAAADELSRRFNRHFDFLTIASWTEDTRLGKGGIALSNEETDACARRAAALFGLNENFFDERPAECISDWAREISKAIMDKLQHFSFKPAARDDGSAPCVHAADEIYQDAAAAANLLYGRRRLLSFVSPHSLIGFELTVLTPNLLHIDAIDARGMPPDILSKTLLFGDVLIATPTLWRYMMRENLTAPDNTMAVSFGEPMTPDLAAEMRKSGFGVMRELYGSTETGLIGWRDAPSEAFRLFDHWRREDGSLVRETPSAHLRPVQAMDVLEWTGDQSFSLQGRRDGAVQIGAVNVFPAEVAKALRAHPKVADCEVTVGRRGDGVSRLIAHLVLEKGALPDERTAREIDVWCRLNLRQQERPRIFNFEAALNDGQ